MNTRQQIQLSSEEQTAFFRAQRKATLASIDGEEFDHRVAQKVVNIQRNPKAALMIEAGDAYAELRGVMVRGRCEIIEGAEAVRAAFAGMAEARGTTPSRPSAARDSAPKRVVLKIIPEKVTSWDHRKLGGRY